MARFGQSDKVYAPQHEEEEKKSTGSFGQSDKVVAQPKPQPQTPTLT